MLVTLKQAPALTVVGQYACVPASQSVPQLESVGLPTPDWVATVEEARSHFPGGCDVRRCLWVCVDSKATTSAVWTMLTSTTRILVRAMCHMYMWTLCMVSIDTLVFLISLGSVETSGVSCAVQGWT